jgi:hypothetical protein
VELLRNLAWLLVVISMLRELDVNRVSERFAYRYGALFLGAGILLTGKFAWSTDAAVSLVAIVGTGLMISALVLILTEQLFRNAPFDARSGLRYFCVGLAGIFVYDLLVYSLIIVSDYLNASQWAARGFVNAVFAVPLVFAVHRSFRLTPDKDVPYQFTFYVLSIIAMTTFIARFCGRRTVHRSDDRVAYSAGASPRSRDEELLSVQVRLPQGVAALHQYAQHDRGRQRAGYGHPVCRPDRQQSRRRSLGRGGGDQELRAVRSLELRAAGDGGRCFGLGARSIPAAA